MVLFLSRRDLGDNDVKRNANAFEGTWGSIIVTCALSTVPLNILAMKWGDKYLVNTPRKLSTPDTFLHMVKNDGVRS